MRSQVVPEPDGVAPQRLHSAVVRSGRTVERLVGVPQDASPSLQRPSQLREVRQSGGNSGACNQQRVDWMACASVGMPIGAPGFSLDPPTDVVASAWQVRFSVVARWED